MNTDTNFTNRLPFRHPASDIVAAYAAGSLEPAVALVIATHLEMCTDCLADYEAAITIGGAMLRQLEVPASEYAEASYGKLAPSFDQLNALNVDDADEKTPVNIQATNQIVAEAVVTLPKILQEFLNNTKAAAINADSSIDESLAGLPWQKRTKNLRFAQFNVGQIQDDDSVENTLSTESGCNFIELQAGSSLPKHTHKGEEYMVVLTGTLQDEYDTYQPGDLVYADSSVTHTPKALSTCVCLAATTAPLKFTGWRGSVMNMLGMGRL